MHRVVLSAFLALSLTSSAFGGGTVTWPSAPLPPDANPAATSLAPILGWLNYFELNLQRAHKLMLERSEDLARLMTTEQGKPLRAARNEVRYAADFLSWFAEEATATVGGTPMKMRSGVSRKPPPTPNTPDRNPTMLPRTSRTKTSSDTSAMGR